MNMKAFFAYSFASLFLTLGLGAGQTLIKSAGVLGNSGYAGDTLVRYVGKVEDRSPISGLGVDKSGYLWAFGGTAAINRYSVDGRQLGTYPVPKVNARSRLTLSVVGNQVMLCAGDKLWTLSADSPSGTEFTALPIPAKVISTSAIGNRIAMISPEGDLSVLDVVTRQIEPRGTLPEGARRNSIVLLPDGTLIVDFNLKITPEGQHETIKLPGSNPVWLDGSLFVFNWHTTIQRVDENGSPTPGVVMGGSSGSFIGTLPKDGEMNQSIGLVQLSADRWATAGALGIIHILHWSDQKNAFEWVRRIGAVHRSSGLGIDRQGRVWWNCGYWDWTDSPSTFPRDTLHMTDNDGWQMVFLPNDSMVGLSSRREKPILVCGPIAPAPRVRYDENAAKAADDLPKNSTGAVLIGKGQRPDVVFVDAAGKGARVAVAANGQFNSFRNKITIKLSGSMPADITSLGRTPNGQVLAADGGAIVRLNTDGDTWTETARYTGWAGMRFGKRITIATDEERLWVSDTENNRVLLFGLTEEGPLKPPVVFLGDPAIGKLQSPGRISASGNRAVVVDEGNQRLVKLEVTEL